MAQGISGLSCLRSKFKLKNLEAKQKLGANKYYFQRGRLSGFTD